MATPDLRAAACGVSALAAVALLAAAGGGYGTEAWGWGGLACASVAAAALALGGGPCGRREQLFAGGLLVFALWVLLSAAWSRSVPSSILEAQRLLVACAGVLAALALCRRGDALLLRLGIVGAVALVCLANLGHRLGGTDGTAGADAAPVGYANGLAILAVVGILLALDVGRAWPVAWLALPPAAAVLLLSESVGAQLALVAGLAVAGVAAGGRARVAGLLALAASGALAAFAFSGHLREHYWSVAWDAARERPLAGSGAGTFAQLWLLGRDVPQSARDAHSLYLETLAEVGLVGLALLVATLALPLLAARRRRLGPFAVGGYAAFLVHAGVDWDWELTGVALAGLLAGGSLLVEARESAEVRGRAGWLAVAVALAAAAGITLAGALQPSLAPWSTEAALERAGSAIEVGDRARARTLVRESLERDPNEWRLWQLLAQLSVGAERERALGRAHSLNPLGSG